MTTYQYKEENIILVGQSLGTGVAAKMAIMFPDLRGVVMISPYKSIQDVAKNMFGPFAAKFVPDIFKTKEIIEEIKPPILFIHGVRDELIPCVNSSYLYDHCNSPRMLNISPTMSHNKLNYQQDVYLPTLKFFVEKLDMDEFSDDYSREEVGRVYALCSLDTNETRKSKLAQKCKDLNLSSIDIGKTQEVRLDTQA